MSGLLILAEDEKGPQFFRNLVIDLKNKGLIPEFFSLKVVHQNACCNYAINRQIKAAELYRTFSLILLIVDGNTDVFAKRRDAQKHIEDEYTNRARVIVIKNEIEEWICISQGYSINDRPHKVLKRELRYKKRQLPKMISKLEYSILYDHSDSFKRFIDLIKDFL